MSRYRHRSTAINGVILFLQRNYRHADIVQEMLKSGRLIGVNEFMRSYRLSRGNNPSNNCDKNAIYIQNDFKSFIQYCKKELVNRSIRA
ncbi:hypothetical protein CLV99_0974 [Sphingobacterium yanglingense]|uniref:Uncharacterized protein n=1 Tax=Sphingobacterium yanglingense TaxID=1437280 RepID=A0A4R6WLC2_9SPHI|nr:hypothetical protein CLV99_0974 [Sphingobacterium yanglingense]